MPKPLVMAKRISRITQSRPRYSPMPHFGGMGGVFFFFIGWFPIVDDMLTGQAQSLRMFIIWYSISILIYIEDIGNE